MGVNRQVLEMTEHLSSLEQLVHRGFEDIDTSTHPGHDRLAIATSASEISHQPSLNGLRQ